MPSLISIGASSEVKPGDDRPLVQREAEPGPNSRPNAVFSSGSPISWAVARAGHLVGGHPGLDHLDGGVDPLPGLFVRVQLRLAGPPDREAAVIAGPVAVVGVHDVEERLLLPA